MAATADEAELDVKRKRRKVSREPLDVAKKKGTKLEKRKAATTEDGTTEEPKKLSKKPSNAKVAGKSAPTKKASRIIKAQTMTEDEPKAKTKGATTEKSTDSKEAAEKKPKNAPSRSRLTPMKSKPSNEKLALAGDKDKKEDGLAPKAKPSRAYLRKENDSLRKSREPRPSAANTPANAAIEATSVMQFNAPSKPQNDSVKKSREPRPAKTPSNAANEATSVMQFAPPPKQLNDSVKKSKEPRPTTPTARTPSNAACDAPSVMQLHAPKPSNESLKKSKEPRPAKTPSNAANEATSVMQFAPPPKQQNESFKKSRDPRPSGTTKQDATTMEGTSVMQKPVNKGQPPPGGTSMMLKPPPGGTSMMLKPPPGGTSMMLKPPNTNQSVDGLDMNLAEPSMIVPLPPIPKKAVTPPRDNGFEVSMAPKIVDPTKPVNASTVQPGIFTEMNLAEPSMITPLPPIPKKAATAAKEITLAEPSMIRPLPPIPKKASTPAKEAPLEEPDPLASIAPELAQAQATPANGDPAGANTADTAGKSAESFGSSGSSGGSSGSKDKPGLVKRNASERRGLVKTNINGSKEAPSFIQRNEGSKEKPSAMRAQPSGDAENGGVSPSRERLFRNPSQAHVKTSGEVITRKSSVRGSIKGSAEQRGSAEVAPRTPGGSRKGSILLAKSVSDRNSIRGAKPIPQYNEHYKLNTFDIRMISDDPKEIYMLLSHNLVVLKLNKRSFLINHIMIGDQIVEVNDNVVMRPSDVEYYLRGTVKQKVKIVLIRPFNVRPASEFRLDNFKQQDGCYYPIIYYNQFEGLQHGVEIKVVNKQCIVTKVAPNSNGAFAFLPKDRILDMDRKQFATLQDLQRIRERLVVQRQKPPTFLIERNVTLRSSPNPSCFGTKTTSTTSGATVSVAQEQNSASPDGANYFFPPDYEMCEDAVEIGCREAIRIAYVRDKFPLRSILLGTPGVMPHGDTECTGEDDDGGKKKSKSKRKKKKRKRLIEISGKTEQIKIGTDVKDESKLQKPTEGSGLIAFIRSITGR